jgi:DNA-binding beta-propeller fold protein YncE
MTRCVGSVWLVAAWVAAAACGDGGDTTPDDTCRTSSDCTSGRTCLDGRCVELDAGDVPDRFDADVAPDDGGPSDVPCLDLDGDGHGPGCAAGLDCDDADPAHFEDCADCPTTHAPGCSCVAWEDYDCYEGPEGTAGVGECAPGTRACVDGHLVAECAGQVLPAEFERCGDGLDNDCDGAGDEEMMSPCGDCDLTCRTDGPVEPAPDDPGSVGLVESPAGPGVTLGRDELSAGYAWIANADEGTVSRLLLETGVEEGRLRVGLTGTAVDSPSRTAVDGAGNAYVASRAHMNPEMDQGSVTKLAGDPRYCIDRDGDGVVTTSTGSFALPLGTDECVLWTTPLCDPAGIPRALAVDAGDSFAPAGYPWVGCWNDLRFWKLEPATGAALASVEVDVQPYGAAVGPDGSIWVAGMRPLPGFLQRFDPATGVADPAISTADSDCSSLEDLDRAPYGISVDRDGRVWVTSFDRSVCRYNPAAGTWTSYTMPLGVTRGVATAADGRVWVANYDFGGSALVSFDGNTGGDVRLVDTLGVAPIGVGLDELGHVWAVNQSSNSASRLTVATGTLESFPVGLGPYCYSDFTGYQRRTVVPRGVWTRDYERCVASPDDRWGRITWDADVPAGATLTIVAASAATMAGLETAAAVTVARVPTATSPADVHAAFVAAGLGTDRFLRVTIVLEPSTDGDVPVLRSVRIDWRCSVFG